MVRSLSVRRASTLLALALAACTSSTSVTPTASVTEASAPPPAAPTIALAPTAQPEPPGSRPSGPKLDDPVVAWDEASFPIARSLSLHAPPLDDPVTAAVRGAVSMYLIRLDYWRENEKNWFPAPGAFGEAVKAGLTASARPGVKRKFELGSVRVERYLVKPWGVPALADVTATIIDKVVEGNGSDEFETGRLRLKGDRLNVIDGWDAANGRWFNGGGAEAMAQKDLVPLLRDQLTWYLRLETWLPGSPIETGYGPGTSPFWSARHEQLKAFDRSKILSRTFADLRARVERYDTFTELRDGLATVLLTGTVVTSDASGYEQRAPLSRRVLMLVGNWTPEVVDEEISAGKWMSAGELYAGLKERDRNFA